MARFCHCFCEVGTRIDGLDCSNIRFDEVLAIESLQFIDLEHVLLLANFCMR